jgi:hypothetical protein
MEKKQTHVVYGLVTGGVVLVVYFAIYLAGLAFRPGIQYVPFIPFAVGVIINCMAYSKANNAEVTFMNVFGSGFKASMIVTLITVLWCVICIIVFPEIKREALEVAKSHMAKDPQMTETMLKTNMEFMTSRYATITISSAIFAGLVAGLLFSLLGALMSKRNAGMPSASNFGKQF